MQIYLRFSEREYLRPKVRVRISEKKTKRILSFLEREYFRAKLKDTNKWVKHQKILK